MGGCCASVNVDPEYVAGILVDIIKEGLDVNFQHGSTIANEVEKRLSRILWPTKELQAVSPKARRASSLGTLTPNRSNDHLEINPRRSRPSSSMSSASRRGSDFALTPMLPNREPGALAGASAGLGGSSGALGVSGGDGGDSLSAMDLNAPTSPTRVTAAPTPAGLSQSGVQHATAVARPSTAHDVLNVTPDWNSVHAVLDQLIGTTSDLHETVLHFAVRRNVTEVVRVLLLFRPNILRLNDRGNSVLHLACIAGCKEDVVLAILQYEWSNSSALVNQADIEVENNHFDGMNSSANPPPLLRRSSSANSEQRFVTDERIRESLMLELPSKQASDFPPEARQKIVLKLVNMKNDDGDAALHLATRNRFGWLVRALLANGADRSAKNREGDTALDIIRMQNGGLAQNPLSRNLFVRKKKSAPGPWWREDMMTEQFLLSQLDPNYKEELWY